MLFSDHDWSSSIGTIQIINRRLVNLLTACRLYIDQTQHDLSQIFEDSSQLDDFRKQTNKEYDSNLGYRVLEQLRNYVQHRGFPIYKNTLTHSRIDKDNNVFGKYTITPYIEVERLKKEGFKAVIIAELEGLGTYIDLKPLLRTYIECLSRLQDTLRKNLAPKLEEWENNLLEISKLYQDTFNDELLGLAIVKIDEGESIIESVDIFDDMVKRYKWFIQRNQLLVNLSSQIITSE